MNLHGSNPTIATLELEHGGRKRRFNYPVAGNMSALLREVFEGREYPIVQIPGHEVRVIVDIGANIGAAALFFHVNFPQARVVCFEPSPTSFVLLQSNLADEANVELHQAGLLDCAERLRLFVGNQHCMQNSLMQSIETSEAFEEVEVRRASDEFKRLGLDAVSILKIDTEGSELPILRDLSAMLERVDLLYLEYHSEADRRAIDALLSETMVLLCATVTMLHRGSMVYLSKRLAPECAAMDVMRITPR